jgi:hypothetical protein
MDHQVAPKDEDILVDDDLYHTLQGLRTLIESMCDGLPPEKRAQACSGGSAVPIKSKGDVAVSVDPLPSPNEPQLAMTFAEGGSHAGSL